MGRTQRKRLQRKLRDKPLEDNVPHTSAFMPALYKYLNATGWQNTTRLSARWFPQTGRGLYSKIFNFNSGDDLIRLPVHSLITINTLEQDAEFKSLFDNGIFTKESRLSFQALLALYLLHQQHLHLQNHASQIGPYLDSLPTQLTVPYFCSIGELQCLPEAILERTVAQNRKIRDSYLNLKTIFDGSSNCKCCGRAFFTDIYTLAEFRWAYFAVNTRSIYINASQIKPENCFFQDLIEDSTNMALAPFLDLFNHSDGVETVAELVSCNTNSSNATTTKTTQNFELVLKLEKCPEAVKPYKELFISYGVLPNIKLLTDYGFFIEQNKHEYFELSLLDIENLIKYDKSLRTQTFHRNKFKFIREHNLHDQMFIHHNDGSSHNLRVVLHLIFKEQSHYPNVLNQIAFGDAAQFQNVEGEVRLLVAFKIVEYQRYVDALIKMPELSPSGSVALEYMLECVRYLEEFESAQCNN